jgi:hypothetical protein
VSTLSGIVLLATIIAFFGKKASSANACLMSILLAYLLTLSLRLTIIVTVWPLEFHFLRKFLTFLEKKTFSNSFVGILAVLATL